MATGTGTKSKKPMSPSQDSVVYYCGICTVDLSNAECIHCDHCEAWVHADSKCSGISPRHYKLISDSPHLSYVCSNCKNEDRTAGSGHSVNNPMDAFKITSPPPSSDLTQLINTVQTLAQSVQTLHDDIKIIKPLIQSVHSLRQDVDNLKATVQTLVQTPSVLSDNPQQIQKLISEEVVETREREKRANFIIVRGLDFEPSSVQDKFNEVVSHLLPGQTVNLNDIMPIKPKLFRAKVLDPMVKRQLLNSAKNLRQSPFSHIYINKDLTYKQRQLIRERNRTPSTQAPQTIVHSAVPQVPSTTSTQNSNSATQKN